MEARREDTFTIGSPNVFQTAPPQPASKARSTIEPIFVGGAEASQNGFGDLMPARLMLRSAILESSSPGLVIKWPHLGGLGVTIKTPIVSAVSRDKPRHRRKRKHAFITETLSGFVLFDLKFTFGASPERLLFAVLIRRVPRTAEFAAIWTDLNRHSIKPSQAFPSTL
jgi:hypothetical protein